MNGNSSPIKAIVARFGGQTRLATILGTKQSTVWEWVENGRVPSARIPAIIDAAAKLTPPIELQPNDFFAARTKGIDA